MSGKPVSPETTSAAPVGYRLWLARAALLWEQVWPALWPSLALVVFYLILAMFGTWQAAPWWLHLAAFVLFITATVGGVVFGLRGLNVPQDNSARRRIETASGLTHRPLETLEDRPATDGDPSMDALWAEHQRRAAAAARNLKVGWPAAGLGRRADPWGLRVVFALLLVIGIAFAGADAPERALQAVSPTIEIAASAPVTIDAWITPPGYTGKAPIFLQHSENAETIKVPLGSVLFARVQGPSRPPELQLDGKHTPFNAGENRNYDLQATITKGTSVAIQQGKRPLGNWPIAIVPDRLPTVGFTSEPGPSGRDAFRLAYEAKDDYGLVKVTGTIKRLDNDEVMTLDLPLTRAGHTVAKETSYHDLTPHPWAGLPVMVQLHAIDEIDQQGHSAEVEVVLPERQFRHPVARAIVEQRKVLLLAPEKRNTVARTIDRISREPYKYYDDTTAFLVLRIASTRLRTEAVNEAERKNITDMLWNVALRIEDGNLSLAESDLRAAQDALQEALSRDASDEEIRQKMQEVRDAMNRFMQALAERALQRQQSGEKMPQMTPGQMMQAEDLQKMLQRAEDLARGGAKDAAKDLMAQLRKMLENMREGMMAEMMEGDAEGLLNELSDLMRMQQELLDEAFRQQQAQPGQQGQQGQQGQRGQQGQQGQRGQQGQGQQGQQGTGPMADKQESLRRMLGEMMRRLGEAGQDIPGALGRAERSMNDARGELEARRPGQAVGPMTDALDQLRQGANSVMRDLMEAMGQDPNSFEGGANPMNRVGRDPLGRPQAGLGNTDDERVAIPEEAEIQRTREILRELYRRAGDRTRSQTETDYIERLLRRF